jgi:hypothetical protein
MNLKQSGDALSKPLAVWNPAQEPLAFARRLADSLACRLADALPVTG